MKWTYNVNTTCYVQNLKNRGLELEKNTLYAKQNIL